MKKFKTQHALMLKGTNYNVITEEEFRRISEEDKQARLIDSRKAISIARKFMNHIVSNEDILLYYETGKAPEYAQEGLGIYLKVNSLLGDIRGVYSPKDHRLYYKNIMEYMLKCIYDPEEEMADKIRFILTRTLNFVEDEINVELETPNSNILKKIYPYTKDVNLYHNIPGIYNAYTTNEAYGRGGHFLIRLDNDYYNIPNEYLVLYKPSPNILIYKDGEYVTEGDIVEKCNKIKKDFDEKLSHRGLISYLVD